MSPTGAEGAEGSRRRPPAHRIACLLALAATGCAGPPEPPPPIEPDPVIAAPRVRPAPPEPDDDELCAVLASVASNETAGFSGLRGARLADQSWVGTETLPGTLRCRIEGDAWPRARYVCEGAAFAAEGRGRAETEFEELAREIDRCLASPIWFPREWRRSERFEFAMGERLQAWTDGSTAPPSTVVLKVHQDLIRHDYRLKLALETAP
jgi:hypothetical protein